MASLRRGGGRGVIIGSIIYILNRMLVPCTIVLLYLLVCANQSHHTIIVDCYMYSLHVETGWSIRTISYYHTLPLGIPYFHVCVVLEHVQNITVGYEYN